MKCSGFNFFIIGSLMSSVFAVDAVPRGQLQLQATYFEPKIGADARWALAMPNNFIGITAVENLTNSALMGHWQVGIDPLVEANQVELQPQLAFLNWRQGVINLWGGRLPSLEKAYLEDVYAGTLSLPAKGLAVQPFYAASENKAVRIDATSGENLVFSGQWVIDENVDELVWSAATAVQSPEGSFALTYHKDADNGALWGNYISWQSGNVVLSGVWMYQKKIVGWDLEARFLSQGVESFIGFSQDANEANRWSIGLHQKLSPSVTNYSEVVRWSQTGNWQWTTGFQLRF